MFGEYLCDKIRYSREVEIKDGSVRGDDSKKELHLGNTSGLALSIEKVENVVMKEESVVLKKISEIKHNNFVNFRATIVQAFEPRFFSICPECKSKAVQDADGFSCMTHGVKKAIDRFKPDILLCSHVHEAEGIEEKIGSTTVINVGKKGKIIEL